MQVTLWGTRGSLAAPGADTIHDLLCGMLPVTGCIR
jgi:hypothetical protein